MKQEPSAKGLFFDLHIHTSAVSRCGMIPPEDVTGLYAAAGYTGIAITDHFFKAYFDSLGDLPWEAKIDRYLEGYRRAKQNSHGLKVYLGMEYRNTCTDDDFLVLGLTEEFFYTHPETYLLPWEKAFDLFHQNDAVVIQAHPCRMRLVQYSNGRLNKDFLGIEMLRYLREHPGVPRIDWNEGMEKFRQGETELFRSPVFLRLCSPRCIDRLDGVEVYNGNQNWMQDPAEVAWLCEEHPELFRISSSDFHAVQHCARGGIELPFVPENDRELASALRSRKIVRLLTSRA